MIPFCISIVQLLAFSTSSCMASILVVSPASCSILLVLYSSVNRPVDSLLVLRYCFLKLDLVRIETPNAPDAQQRVRYVTFDYPRSYRVATSIVGLVTSVVLNFSGAIDVV